MANVGYATMQVIPSLRGFDKAVASQLGALSGIGDKAGKQVGASFMSRVGRTVGGAIAGVGRVIATGLGIATLAIAGMGVSLIKTGIQYNKLEQTSRAAFKTILGSAKAANKMMDSIHKFAQTSPFPRQAFIEATRQMLGFGFAAKDIIPTLAVIQDAVAAMGKGAPEILQIVDIFSKIKSQGKIMTDELNRLAVVGINGFEILAKSAGKSVAQIRDDVSDGAIDSATAIAALTKGMAEKYGGAAANVKKTWEGAVDRIKARWRDMGSAIVEPFISKKGGGLALEWVNTLADAMSKLRDDVIPPLAARIGNLAKPISGLLENVAKFVTGLDFSDKTKGLDKFGSSMNRLNDMTSPAVSLWDKVKSAVSGLGPIISGVSAAFTTLGIKGMPVVGQFVTGLNPLLIGFAVFAATSSKVRNAIKGVVQTVEPAIKAFGSKLAPIIKDLAPKVQDLAAAVVHLGGKAFKLLVEIVTPFLPALGKVAGFVLNAAIAFTKFAGKIINLIDGPLKTVVGWIAKVTNAFLGNETAVKIVAGLIGGVMIPIWIRMAVMATVSAVKVAAAWVMQQVAAVKSTVIQSAKIVWMIARWAFYGVRALFHAGQVAAAWLLSQAGAIKAAAVTTAQVGIMIGKWVALKAAALFNAGGVATAWGTAGLASQSAASRVGLAATAMNTAGGKAGGMGGKVAGAAAATGGLAKVAAGAARVIPVVGSTLVALGIDAAMTGDKFKEADIKVKDFTAAILQDNGVLGETTKGLVATALEQEGFIGNLTRMGIGLGEVTTAVEKGGSSLSNLKQKIFEQATAAGLSNTQSEHLADSLGRLSGQFKGGAAAARAMAIFTGVATKATYPLYLALQKAGVSAGVTKRAMGAYTSAIKEAGSRTGITAAQKQKHIATLQALANKLSGPARAALLKHIAVIKAIPPGKQTKITAETAEAQERIRKLKAKIAGMKNKFIKIYITPEGKGSFSFRGKRYPVEPHSGGYILPSGKLQKYHTGGLVSGLRHDEVPAVLQTREGVLNRRAMSMLGIKNLHALNKGNMPFGGITIQQTNHGTVNAEEVRRVTRQAVDESLGGFVSKSVLVAKAGRRS